MRQDVVWAVAPLANESGVRNVQTDRLADALVGAITDVQGLAALPFNRTLAAMQALGMQRVETVQDAQALAQVLGADGIVVGSITSYDPYTPELGISLALFARPGMLQSADTSIDIKDLRTSTADVTTPQSLSSSPLAQVNERFDARNNQVLMDVRAYADGRLKDPSAFGWRRYLASMDLYSQFAMTRATETLVQQEWVRVARAGVPNLPPRPVAITPERTP